MSERGSPETKTIHFNFTEIAFLFEIMQTLKWEQNILGITQGLERVT